MLRDCGQWIATASVPAALASATTVSTPLCSAPPLLMTTQTRSLKVCRQTLSRAQLQQQRPVLRCALITATAARTLLDCDCRWGSTAETAPPWLPVVLGNAENKPACPKRTSESVPGTMGPSPFARPHRRPACPAHELASGGQPSLLILLIARPPWYRHCEQRSTSTAASFKPPIRGENDLDLTPRIQYPSHLRMARRAAREGVFVMFGRSRLRFPISSRSQHPHTGDFPPPSFQPRRGLWHYAVRAAQLLFEGRFAELYAKGRRALRRRSLRVERETALLFCVPRIRIKYGWN